MTSACHACLGHQAAAAISHCGNGRWCGMPLKPCQPQCRPWCRPAPFCVISVHVDLWWVVSAAFCIHVQRVSRAWPSVGVFFSFFFFLPALGHPLRRPRSTTPPPRHPPVLPPPAALVVVVAITFQVTQRLPPRPHLPRLPRPHWQAMPLPVLPVHRWQPTLPQLGLLWCPTPT